MYASLHLGRTSSAKIILDDSATSKPSVAPAHLQKNPFGMIFKVSFFKNGDVLASQHKSADFSSNTPWTNDCTISLFTKSYWTNNDSKM